MNNKLFLPLSLLLSFQATATFSMEAPTSATETPISAAAPTQDGADAFAKALLNDYGLTDEPAKPKIEEGEYNEKRYSPI